MTIDAAALEGKAVFSSDGISLGNVAAVFRDKDTNKPEWLALRRGRFGGKQVLIPVATATVEENRISVPYSEAEIDGAPESQGSEVSQETERALASHFRVAYSERRSETGLAEAGAEGRTAARGSRRRASGSAPDGPTRDELYAEAKQLGIEGRSRMKKAELARAIEKVRGRSSSRGAGKANPIEVQKFLEGVDYPVRKGDLVREAKRQGAHSSVRSTLERIRDEKFDSPADVSEAIGRLS